MFIFLKGLQTTNHEWVVNHNILIFFNGLLIISSTLPATPREFPKPCSAGACKGTFLWPINVGMGA
jgi:hypothetical protein